MLPFVGLIPLALFIQGLPGDRAGRRAAVRGSLVFGTIYFGVVFYWILIALVWFTKLAILAYIASVIMLAGAAALFGWMLHGAVHEVRAPLWIALPVMWTATEWFRAHWPGPLAFPWLGLGTSLTGFPELVGSAEIVGARGITFWIALVNGLFAVLVLRWRTRAPRTVLALATGVVLVVPPAWGAWRARTLEVRAVGQIAVVQPNIPEHIKIDARSALDSTFASLDRLMPRIEPGSVKAVIMPEVTFSAFPRSVRSVEVTGRVQRYAREVGAPILFGSLGFADDGNGGYVPFNSAFLMEPRGLTEYQYDKRFLVPVVERVPLVPSSWLRRLPYFGSFGVGQGWPIAEVDEVGLGALVCYESTYPEGARQLRLAGADVLVNITNDAWYGREPWYARTTALWQHPAHMVMRAIENRTGVARAANTGISLFVDPLGRVYDATNLFEADVRVGTVYTTDVLTFYTRYGDLIGNGAALAALLLVATALAFRRRFGARSA